MLVRSVQFTSTPKSHAPRSTKTSQQHHSTRIIDTQPRSLPFPQTTPSRSSSQRTSLLNSIDFNYLIVIFPPSKLHTQPYNANSRHGKNQIPPTRPRRLDTPSLSTTPPFRPPKLLSPRARLQQMASRQPNRARLAQSQLPRARVLGTLLLRR